MNLNFLFGLPAYHLATVNILMVFALVIGLLFYTYIYPKKYIPCWVLVTLFSILPIVSFFRIGDLGGGLYVNTSYAVSFYKSLQEGILFPRWAGDLNTFYGYPAFNFLYPLPFYLSSFFHFIGFTFINSMKLVFVASFLFSGLTMFVWLRSKYLESIAATAALIYQFAPYRFVDLHFRLDVGESLAFVFMPLVFYAVESFSKKNQTKWLILGAIFTGLLILSHQLLSMATICLALIYFIFHKPFHLKNFTPILFGITLSAFYWLPVIFEYRFTHLGGIAGNVYFPAIWEFISSPWRWGFLFQGPQGEVSPAIGFAQWSVIILSFLKKISGFWIMSFIIIFILMQKQSEVLWMILPGLKMFQFSWRLVGLEVLIVPVLAAQVMINTPKKFHTFISIILISIAVFGTILNWSNRESGSHQISDAQLQTKLPLADGGDAGFSESLPIWVPKNILWGNKTDWLPITLVRGQASINQITRTSIIHRYHITVKEPSDFIEHTYYFPGWTLFINGMPKPIKYQKTTGAGIINFSLAPGNYLVELEFKNTPVRNLGLIISFSSVVFLVTCKTLFYKRQSLG